MLIPVLVVFASACGGPQTPAAAPEANSGSGEEQSASSAEEPADEGGGGEAEAAQQAPAIPTECHPKAEACVPNPKFVQRLCNGRYPSMALYLFGNGKWTRAYLTRKTEAWNASGGASAGGFLEFDEEVLLLAERKADKNGMQIGSGVGYDALRWDGSCVTLSGEEVTQKKPPSAKNVKVEWRFLDDNVQEALRKDEAINGAYLERRKECKGAVSGDVSAACVKADQKLSDAIVRYVRNGGTVPVPTTLPE
nr:MAG: hypothetical protein DIU78_07055 [Pseudomonadota bacterium]